MTIDEFLRQRPCLEELDGYLDAIKPGGVGQGLDLTHDALTPEILRAAEDYRKRLLKGKVVPEKSGLWRQWEYQFGKPPKRKPGPPPEFAAQSPTARRGSAPDDRPAYREDSQRTYLVAKPRR